MSHLSQCVYRLVYGFIFRLNGYGNMWLVGVAVSTTDSDSVDGGSIPSRAFLTAGKGLQFFLFSFFFQEK